MPLSDEQRLIICELADECLPVRQIAARLGVAPSTVTREAQRMGLAFDRSTTEKATAVRIADAKARRSMTALRLLGFANQGTGPSRPPYRAHAFLGGQIPGYYEHVLPQPDAATRLAIVRTAALRTQSAKVGNPGSPTGASGAAPRAQRAAAKNAAAGRGGTTDNGRRRV